ncbi:hypothetical protein TNCV_2039301 [Trichonephila clavipes]|nr:hypothetical protein TNCV_2039301 [Trichonephila clavipes]
MQHLNFGRKYEAAAVTVDISRLSECYEDLQNVEAHCTTVRHYHKRKLLSDIDVSGKAGKVSKTANALDIHRLPTPLKTLKRFLWWYGHRFQYADEIKRASQTELKNRAKMDSGNVSMTFTRDGKNVLLLKGLISKKDVFQQFNCDEAHFWLNGYVNKQNCRIWSEANPQVYVETPLHPKKLTVWCALWAGGLQL